MKGREYCRRMVRATCAGAAGLALVDGRGLGRLALEPGGEVASRRAARRRRSTPRPCAGPRDPPPPPLSVSATTPAKLPSRTTAMTPGNAARTRFVERRQLGARRRGLQHAAVQHAGQRQIVHEARPAEHLVGQVEPWRRRAGDAPRGRCLGGDPGAGIARQQGVVGQLPIAGAQVAGADDGAVLDLEALGAPRPGAAPPPQIDRRAPAPQRSAPPSPTARPTGCPR